MNKFGRVTTISINKNYLPPQMGLSTHEVGLVFLFCSILYGISSPFWGYIADKYDNHWSMMAIGLLTSTVGLFILAPLPWLSVNKE